MEQPNLTAPAEVVEKKEKAQETPKEELVSRVSKFKPEEPKKEETIFNVKDIEKIEDPKAREYAEKAYKSMLGDYTRKTQELAEMRRSLEAGKTEKWTPEKVQSLLNDQTFVEAAQSVVGKPKEDDSSMLTEAEKHEIAVLKDQVKQMQANTWQAYRLQQDAVLKNKYANYNPQAVDIITSDLMQGKRQVTREDIYKAMDYDEAVKRAYELGKQDSGLDKETKVIASSFDGGTVTATGTPPEKEKGESDRAYFKRLAERNLAAFINKKK